MSVIAFPNLNFNAVLTKRENEIIEPLAMARSKKEIPDLISPTKKGTPVSVATITHTSKSIYRKIGAQKAAEITIWWFVRKYNIPVAILFLSLIVSQEFLFNYDTVRRLNERSTRTKTKVASYKSRKTDEDLIYGEILLEDYVSEDEYSQSPEFAGEEVIQNDGSITIV